MSAPLALLGFPSVQSIVEGIVEFFFQDLAKALVPDFLKKASVASIRWLVELPDPTAWPHVAQLEGDMAALAGSLLAVSFTAAIVRYLTVGVTGSASPLAPLSSTVSSAAMIVGYRWAAHEAVAGVNAFTGSILGFSVVGDGLQRTVGLLFGGALLVGSGSLFFALLVIVAVVFAAVMFAVKVLLLIGVGLLYVTGLLAIALRPLGDAGGLARAWLSMAMTIALVPIGWTILFALAGALSLDATSFGAAGGGGLPGHIAAALAALLTFYLAVKLPLAALSHLRSSIVGMASGARASGSSASGGSGGAGGGVGRMTDAHARLRAGGLQAGRTIGSAAGALGAPAGGAVGLAGRAAAGLAGPVGFGIAAAGALASRRGGRSGSGNGTASAASAGGGASPRTGDGGERDGSGGSGGGGSAGGEQEAGGLRGRVARAGRVLADGPGQVRDAMRAAGSTGTGRSRPSRGGSTGAAGSQSAGKAPRPPRPAEKSPAQSKPIQRNEQARGKKAPTADRPSGKDAPTRPGARTSPPAPPPARRADEAISGDAKARRESSRAPVRKPKVKPPTEGRAKRQPRARSAGREPRPRAVTQRRRWWRLGRTPRKGGG